ncbi:MAG: helix-turn-helix transcriptional regulator [Gammaproteobacteria bacterium]|nr:helix-turn-helix transcriptional regulator [Gammaproteobacteria bacterium]
METAYTRRMRRGANEAAGVLRVLANEARLLLVCQLTEKEHCVSELESALGIHQPTLSQQLSVLRKVGLITARREGKRIYYRVTDQRLKNLLDTVHATFCAKVPRGK